MKKLNDWNGNLEKAYIEYDMLNPSDESDNNLSKPADDSHTKFYESNKHSDYTIKADKTDCLLAVGSGLLTGLLDAFWIGSFNLEDSQKWGREKSDKYVILVAQSQGYNDGDLKGSIQYLERKYINPSDKLMNRFGGSTQHHINDFSHHPTIIGLFFSILTQFTRRAHGIDKEGKYISVPLPDNAVTGKNFVEKISFGLVHWFFHLVSDMSGSSNSPGKGTGIPGPLLSFAKSIASLRIVRELSIKYKGDYVQISLYISRLFTGTIIPNENGQDIIRFDMRTEIGVSAFLGKQNIPVLINHALIRAFYLIKHLYTELKNSNINAISKLKRLDPSRFLPYTNDCTIRMTTISTGVFTVIDSGDAAIRAALHSSYNNIVFATGIIIRLNLPGIVSFAIAVKNEIRSAFFDKGVTQITDDMIELNVDVKIEMNNNELYEYTFNQLLGRLANRRNAQLKNQMYYQGLAPLIRIANEDYYIYSNIVSIAEENIKTALFEMFERLLSINDISYEKVHYQKVLSFNNTQYVRPYPSFKTIIYLNEEKILCVFNQRKPERFDESSISKAINDNVNKILLISFNDPKEGTIGYETCHENRSSDSIIIKRITLRDLFDLCFGKDEFPAFLRYLNEFNNLAQKVAGYSVIRLSEKEILRDYGDDNVKVDFSFDDFCSWIEKAFVYGISSSKRSLIKEVRFSLTRSNEVDWTLCYFLDLSEDINEYVSPLSPNSSIEWLSELNPEDIYLNVLNIIKKYLSEESRGASILKQYSITYSFIDYETREMKEISIS